jgi:hypothetical protein
MPQKARQPRRQSGELSATVVAITSPFWREPAGLMGGLGL